MKVIRGFLGLAAAAVFGAACTATPQAAPGNHATPHHSRGLSALLVLPARTMAAGSSMSGRVVIDNALGRPVSVWTCTPFQVLLQSGRYRPVPVWPLCLRRFMIPVGESSYLVTVTASYDRCSERPSGGPGIPCTPGGLPPPLPAGSYRATVYVSGHRLPVPAAVPVQVTA